MEKPVTLTIDELKRTITEAVNASGLPLFILDYIFRDFYSEIHLLNQNLSEQDRISYESSLKNKAEQEAEH